MEQNIIGTVNGQALSASEFDRWFHSKKLDKP